MTAMPQEQNVSKPMGADKATAINAKIRETWSKLNDEDVRLYSANREQFFARLKEKQNVSREDGERRLQEIEKLCAAGCGSEMKAA